MKDIADLIGRIAISIFFLYEAIDSILFFDNNLATMESYGISFYPKVLLILGITCLLVGSVMVLIGYYAGAGATLLLLYWLPFTLIVYSFWDDPVGVQRINSLYFMRNIALAGGLMLLSANGSGKYSIKRIFHVMRLPQ